jgi:hypothetical protein
MHGRYGETYDRLGITISTGMHFSPELAKPLAFDECGASLPVAHWGVGVISEEGAYGVRVDVDVAVVVDDADELGALTIVIPAREPSATPAR